LHENENKAEAGCYKAERFGLEATLDNFFAGNPSLNYRVLPQYIERSYIYCGITCHVGSHNDTYVLQESLTLV